LIPVFVNSRLFMLSKLNLIFHNMVTLVKRFTIIFRIS
jgi:hypothetical protein